MTEIYLQHHGILGMKWGIRRYQNEDGTLTEAGKKRYRTDDQFAKKIDNNRKTQQKSYELSREAELHIKKSKYYDLKSANAANYSEKKMWEYADKAYDENKKGGELRKDSNALSSKYKSDNAQIGFFLGSLSTLPAAYFINRQSGKDVGMSLVNSLAASSVAGFIGAATAYSSAKKTQEKTKKKYGLDIEPNKRRPWDEKPSDHNPWDEKPSKRKRQNI